MTVANDVKLEAGKRKHRFTAVLRGKIGKEVYKDYSKRYCDVKEFVGTYSGIVKWMSSSFLLITTWDFKIENFKKTK